jgi:streptogramin lyase
MAKTLDQGHDPAVINSHGGLWITGWNSGHLFRFDSKTRAWARRRLPGDGPQPSAVYILRFDPSNTKVRDVSAAQRLRERPQPPAARVKSGAPSPVPTNSSC